MLHVHRAERADCLAEALGELLAQPLEDPFAPETIAVHTRGMERWLTQRLSARLGAGAGRRDGICANVEFPFPGRLIAATLARATGLDPELDPWPPERSVWPLLRVIERSLAEPWLSALANHLGATTAAADVPAGERRFASVRRIAELLHQYGVRRPQMLVAWARGEDADGSGGSLDAGSAWQAELWRRLRAEIGTPSPAERLHPACGRLRADPGLLELPDRISLFGITRLPAAYIEVLSALADGRDVHLFVLHPSPALWDAIASSASSGRRQAIVRRADDTTAALPANRLLASWGQDARELQLVLAGAGSHVDHHHTVEHAGGSLLARIQAGIRADRAAPGRPEPGRSDPRPLLDPGDRSLQVHACHGPARQVEVLRDAILHALAGDLTLEPREIIVMCPDIETFAPLIRATFGAAEREDDDPDAIAAGVQGPNLKVRLADRSLRQTNPLLGVAAELLDLASGRLTASQLLDLADRDPVRRRFGLDDDDLARMRDWVAASGIRWGLDAAHRAPYKLAGVASGTWRAGLDRVLLGATMTEDGEPLFARVLPLDDVDSGAIELAGRFAELVDRVDDALSSLVGPQPLSDWADALAEAAEALTAASPRDAWQRDELGRLLADVVREAGSAAGDAAISLPDVRAVLADRLRGRPTRANFRTGHLTVCTLAPMRSVPHRVVCLLGLDDGAFPRRAPRDGDDLTLADPHVGDRDSRLEDRQMLLDALMAAGEKLIITYTGNDERTNATRPPAVPLGELLDVVDQTVAAEHGAARAQVVVRHPLQPFDPRNFDAARPWSFDQTGLGGARAMSAERREPEPFLVAPLAPELATVVELDGLVQFLQRPVRAFLSQRLGIARSAASDEVQDALSVQLDPLATWAVGQRLLDARLRGTSINAAVKAELARGTLPPGELAWPVIDAVGPTVEEIAERAGLLGGGGHPRSVDVNVPLPDGRTLTGTVPDVCGEVLRTVTFSRLNARHRLAAWVRLLALTAARPDQPFEAATVARAPSSDERDVVVVRIAPLADDPRDRREQALEQLMRLLDLYDRGMREPLPLACAASLAYVHAAREGADPVHAARKSWESDFEPTGDDVEPEHQLVFGGVAKLEQLLEHGPRADESGAGWEEREQTRFGRLAYRMWDELLAHEQVS